MKKIVFSFISVHGGGVSRRALREPIPIWTSASSMAMPIRAA